MVPVAELKRLLTSAHSTVQAREVLPKQSVNIEGLQFNLIARHEAGHGWILILIQDSKLDPDSVEMLRLHYGLTPREVEVAYLLAQRLTNREIAERLHVKLCTAGRHTERVMKKLEVSSRKDVRKRLATG